MDKSKKERLNKYLAACGICSRRDADKLIEEGRVTINGMPAAIGSVVSDMDTITVNGKTIEGKNKR